MANKIVKQVFWACPDSKWDGTHEFGEEVTGLIDDERLEKFLEIGKVTEEKPDSTAHASQTELTKLKEKIEKLESDNYDLKADLKKSPKNATAAKKKIKELESKIDAMSKTDPDQKIVDELETAKKRITDLEGFMADKDDEISKLKADLEEAAKPGAK